MSTNEHQPQSKGIFITDGVDFTIHGLKLSVGPEGIETASHSGMSLRQDLCRYWLRIACDHIREAVQANEELIAEERSDGRNLFGPLEREFRASMQAVVSSAIALDAFYSQVKERVDLPPDQVAAWRDNKTARWKQMAEVFRLAFDLKPEGVTALREHLKEISMFRDWAVHPPAVNQQPVFHPDINRSVEWRFRAFRRHNAVEVTRAAIAIVHRLVGKIDEESPLGSYTKGLQPAVEEIATNWFTEFPEHPVTEDQRRGALGGE